MFRLLAWWSPVLVILLVLGWVFIGQPITSGEGEPKPLPAANLENGRSLYATNCAACHGVEGEGQADWKVQRADETFPAPPHNSTGHTWHHADGMLFETVKKGGGYAAPKTYKATMPAWGDKLSDIEIIDVLEYIKTLWEPWQRETQARGSLNWAYPSR